jgi:hypothetical protein
LPAYPISTQVVLNPKPMSFGPAALSPPAGAIDGKSLMMRE